MMSHRKKNDPKENSGKCERRKNRKKAGKDRLHQNDLKRKANGEQKEYEGGYKAKREQLYRYSIPMTLVDDLRQGVGASFLVLKNRRRRFLKKESLSTNGLMKRASRFFQREGSPFNTMK